MVFVIRTKHWITELNKSLSNFQCIAQVALWIYINEHLTHIWKKNCKKISEYIKLKKKKNKKTAKKKSRQTIILVFVETETHRELVRVACQCVIQPLSASSRFFLLFDINVDSNAKLSGNNLKSWVQHKKKATTTKNAIVWTWYHIYRADEFILAKSATSFQSKIYD